MNHTHDQRREERDLRRSYLELPIVLSPPKAAGNLFKFNKII